MSKENKQELKTKESKTKMTNLSKKRRKVKIFAGMQFLVRNFKNRSVFFHEIRIFEILDHMNAPIFNIIFQETKKTMMISFIIRKIYLWDGMESRFLIGCTNCMAWILITSVKYVAIKLIVVPKHSRDTFRNGVTLTAWDVSVRIVPIYFSLFHVTFLGIPNTAHFANVTEIEDALALWAKLKEQKAHERQSCEIVILWNWKKYGKIPEKS